MARARLSAVGFAAVVALTTSCGSSGRAADPPSLGHVHDIVMVDGRVLLAAHAGLFEVVDGEARQVGQHQHDLMALTSADDGLLLASGHPDLSADELRSPGKPPLLGLLTSDDGGLTWEPRGLLGEADFHALTVADGAIAGLDGASGEVLVSRDGIAWDRRGTVSGQDLAVDPGDRNVFVAVGYDGALTTSSDGGATWTALAAPPLVAVEWGEDGLVGLGPSGVVHISDDRPEGPWRQVGRIGGDGASLLVTEGVWYAATDGPSLLSSDDDGRTWEPLLDPPAA